VEGNWKATWHSLATPFKATIRVLKLPQVATHSKTLRGHPSQVNSVGFYQLSKICITPAVLIFDAMTTAKYPTKKEVPPDRAWNS
jgi:hypothetical protein